MALDETRMAKRGQEGPRDVQGSGWREKQMRDHKETCSEGQERIILAGKVRTGRVRTSTSEYIRCGLARMMII